MLLLKERVSHGWRAPFAATVNPSAGAGIGETFLHRRQEAHKEISASLTSREMQIKASVSCHLTPTRWLYGNRWLITSTGEEEEKLESSHLAGGSAKWRSRVGKHPGRSRQVTGRASIRAGNFTSRCEPKRIGNICLQEACR